ncbi:MAG TPA: 50S ribosomal protein L30 [Candidatus Bathyarchaeia archaeon]|nr:50S ribosomal protein L30 [Candidatus Bathyarchaeia archaeon]
MTEQQKEPKCLAVVRVRGTVRGSLEARETLNMLNLPRNNYAVLVDDSPSFLGMLKAAQSFVTWGEVSKETVNMLIKGKGRLVGNKILTEEYLQKIGYKSLEELAESVQNCKAKYWKLPNIQPVFRLHPPTKGFKGKVKKSFAAGGELGYRGEKINELINRML